MTNEIETKEMELDQINVDLEVAPRIKVTWADAAVSNAGFAILQLGKSVIATSVPAAVKSEILDDNGRPRFDRLLLLLDDDAMSKGVDLLNAAATALSTVGYSHAFRIQVMGGDRRGMWAALATTDIDEANPADVLQRLLTAAPGSVKEIRAGDAAHLK
jgi:hypothetical protein